MSKKQWGSFPDAWGDDDRVFTGGQLAKAVDEDDIDLEGMCRALETLNNRAKTMNKAQLYRLNYKLGLSINKFKEAVQKYLHQKWERNMNQGTLQKVHSNPMNDAGLDPECRDTMEARTSGDRFTKVSRAGGDMGDPFGEDIKK